MKSPQFQGASVMGLIGIPNSSFLPGPITYTTKMKTSQFHILKLPKNEIRAISRKNETSVISGS